MSTHLTVGIALVAGYWLLAPFTTHAQGLLPACDPIPDAFENKKSCQDACKITCSRNPDSVLRGNCENSCLISNACVEMNRSDDCGAESIITLLVNIYNWLLGLAALVGMLMIIWAGVQMLLVSIFEVSPNELMATPLESAKLTLLRAVIGLIIIFLAYVIVNTVLALLGVEPGPGNAVYTILSKYGLVAR